MKRLLVAAIMLFNSHLLMAQTGAFDYFDASHFARTMRLGNTYAGVAEGPETMFYNAAGLADINSYSIVGSSGQGMAFYVKNVDAYDFAAAIPLGKAGTLGASMNSLIFSLIGNDDVTYRIYGLSYAHKFFSSLNIGITANYYHLTFENATLISDNPQGFINRTVKGSAFDVNLSALYKTPVKIFTNDVSQIGFQFKNVMNSEMSLDYTDKKDKMFQNMRAGLSYTLVPDLKPIAGFAPVKFMAAFDAVYMGADYTFFEWQPNYGLELSLMEIFQVSFGRENEKQLKQTYFYSPQHPVNRYGLGFRLPLKSLFNLNYGLDLRFDYCNSDWQKIDEDAEQVPWLHDRINVQDNAFSLGVDLRI